MIIKTQQYLWQSRQLRTTPYVLQHHWSLRNMLSLHVLWGLSRDVRIFIMYKLYILPSKPSHYTIFLLFMFSSEHKVWFKLYYGLPELQTYFSSVFPPMQYTSLLCETTAWPWIRRGSFLVSLHFILLQWHEILPTSRPYPAYKYPIHC